MRRLAVAAVLFLAGCGGQGTTAVTVTRTVTAALPPVASGGPSGLCTVYARGTSEYVVASGAGAASACRTIIRRWSQAGTFWSRYGTKSRQAELVCAMAQGGLALNVYDVASYIAGEATCAALAGAGFTEPPPGE